MPRRTIVLEPEHCYHLYNRGNNHQTVFFERENYLHFLRLVRRYLVVQTLDVLAYCLMPNHYHLLVYFRAGNLSEAMQLLSLAYTKAINRRYDRAGSLFQGRFQSAWVNRDDYLCHLVQYIHLNPVKAGLISNPQEWEFSSYSEYAGLRKGTLPKLETIQRQLESEEAYRSFLQNRELPKQPLLKALMLDE
jgi:putative transposase